MENIRVRARAKFMTRYGMVNGGEIFWSEPDYAEEMEKKGNITKEPLQDKADLRPKNNRMMVPPAPKDPETESPLDPSPARRSGERTGNGAARPAYASPAARRSRKRT